MEVITREGKLYIRWECGEMSPRERASALCPVWNNKGELIDWLSGGVDSGEQELHEGATYTILPRRRYGKYADRFPLYRLPSCEVIASFTGGSRNRERTQIELDAVDIPSEGMKKRILEELSREPLPSLIWAPHRD